MTTISKTLALVAPEVSIISGDSTEFTEQSYRALVIEPESYRPSWGMLVFMATKEGFLSPEANVNSKITVGSLWDRFTLAERIFVRHSSNPLLIRNVEGEFPPYDAIIDDIKDGLSLYGFIDLTRPDFMAGIGYICQRLLSVGLIDDINVRMTALLIEGNESERYKGEG